MIRSATPEDLPAVARLRWRWVSEMSDTSDDSGREEYVEALVEWADAPSATHFCFVAFEDGELIGMAWLALAPRVPSPGSLRRNNGEVQGVYVVPELRGQEIGGQLIGLAVAAAERAGVERTVVHSTEAALTAYERAGFAASPLLLER